MRAALTSEKRYSRARSMVLSAWARASSFSTREGRPVGIDLPRLTGLGRACLAAAVHSSL